MYAYIKGKLVQKDPTTATVEANGIGYEIKIPLSTYEQLKQEACKLYTHLYVREDLQQLFGFFTENEREIFRYLIGVSGIGPNTALTFLSSLQADEIIQVISHGDVKRIQQVKGIGAKTAQRVVLELQDKLKKSAGSMDATKGTFPVGDEYNTMREEALAALEVLGINKNTALKSVDRIMKVAVKDQSINELKLEDLIKKALKTTS
jgi:holliday junction DNA helicase RuvA